MARRDVELAELTGGRVHFAHLSCAASLEALRDAKRRGLAVTGETCPHYWTLTEEAVGEYATHAKMNPPLRSAADRAAVIAAIADGTIDCLATDHAPHTEEEKRQPFDRAPFGIVGLETAVPLSLDRLVHSGRIRLPRLVELLSINPARILRITGGTLSPGAPADITILAPDLEVRVDASKLRSRSKNTPFDGWELRGGVAATIVGGRTLFVNAAAPVARGL
jgi:dihydroorotase